MIKDEINILSVDLLDKHKEVVKSMKSISNQVNKGIGWHYLLDLSWVARKIIFEPGALVLDAGAGWGIMQWWLVENGADVISVDAQSRQNISLLHRAKYKISGLRKQDLKLPYIPSRRNLEIFPKSLMAYVKKIITKNRWISIEGRVFLYNQNLESLPDIKDNSVDFIVSISALEHNTPEGLKKCVHEMMRVLKPGGALIATLGASSGESWYHEPSSGWCYSEESLRDIFELEKDCASNYNEYDVLFDKLKNCKELSDNLGAGYFKSDKNGMPWGVWDPKYQPVGVVKVKK